MRKSFVVAAVAAVVSVNAPAQECQPAANYNVKNLSFPKMEAKFALGELLENTPLKVKLQGGAKGLQVGADGVSGPLDKALNALAGEAGLTWSQQGCHIELVDKPRPVAERKWSVVAGESLETALRRWSLVDGWTVVWDIEEVDSLQMMADASFSGSIQNAVESIGQALANSGERLVFSFHGGNKILRVSRTK